MEKKKTLWEIIKFILVSCIVTVIQLVLVNVLFLAMKGITTPLPSFLGKIFTEQVMGEGHTNWGYILPFFLSNLIANVYGFFQNRKTTFKSNSPGKDNFRLTAKFTDIIKILSFCYVKHSNLWYNYQEKRG